MEESEKTGATIQYQIAALVRAPIAEGEYEVDGATIKVSYPDAVVLASVLTTDEETIPLPRGISTFFQVTWVDRSGVTVRKLLSSSADRFHPLHFALDKINQLLLAFKIVRIHRSDGMQIRTIGDQDTLFYLQSIDGKSVPGLNKKSRYSPYKLIVADPQGITEEALPHLAGETYPIGRRFVRCFELIEHGLYTECLIVAFAILDDTIQIVLKTLLSEKGLSETGEQDELLRSIERQRLKRYLGPLLKLVSGTSFFEMWVEGEKALDWLNKRRNNAMHSGYSAKRRDAAISLFVCMKVLVLLWQKNLLDAPPVTVEMYREAKLKAAWAENPPQWVPKSSAAGKFEFDSVN